MVGDEGPADDRGRPRRVALRVDGTVQGVGFRPFVHRLATELGVSGRIGNDDDGVWCEIQGGRAELQTFLRRLVDDAPPLARVVDVRSSDLPPVPDEAGFVIDTSRSGTGAAIPTIPPDIAPCAACLSELENPADRRHGYPFTCCADCGPRFTVVDTLPYDRERTAMASFVLCELCRSEYASPTDRRFHAQATCCADCGPRLGLDRVPRVDALEIAVQALRAGRIVAVKGIGGYQLLCRADLPDAVHRLRERKRREEKPFALLVADATMARSLVELDSVGASALASPEAPIVLAPRRTGAAVAAQVAPDTALLGVMLPASPLHRLIATRMSVPLVCTSGNASDEPIAIGDRDAADRLGPIADVMLTHDRRIARRADDSIVHSSAGALQILRRARGYAPRPIDLGTDGPPVLGVGAMLKNTVCLALGRRAHVSVHLGDLDHPLALEAFEVAVADLIALTRVEPELVVHDLHPEYLSTKFAKSEVLAPAHGAQHHHAHLASCLAEHRIAGPAIGVTFDGFGWGADDTLWGGEILLGDAGGYERIAHLSTVAVPGGEAAVREPWRMAVAHLHRTFGARPPATALLDRHAALIDDVVALCEPSRSLLTSSMGRLFDAVAAILGVGDRATYEGQAAMRLERLATLASGRSRTELAFEVDDGHPMTIDPSPVIAGVVDGLRSGVGADRLADAFHRALADAVVAVAGRARARSGVRIVALTGGVFQNRRLSALTVQRLSEAGFDVVRHAHIPPNDGGISLGQIAVGRAGIERGTVGARRSAT